MLSEMPGLCGPLVSIVGALVDSKSKSFTPPTLVGRRLRIGCPSSSLQAENALHDDTFVVFDDLEFDAERRATSDSMNGGIARLT
jgi:hypothetical protein